MKPPLISTKAMFQELLGQALQKASDFAAAVPEDPFQKSILLQLQFMAKFVPGSRIPTHGERESINIGVIAMRTFEDTDPEYAKLLSELDYAFSRWESLG